MSLGKSEERKKRRQRKKVCVNNIWCTQATWTDNAGVMKLVLGPEMFIKCVFSYPKNPKCATFSEKFVKRQRPRDDSLQLASNY